MCSGAGLVGSGVGRVSGMCVVGRLLEVVLFVEAFARVALEFVVGGKVVEVVGRL